MLNAVTYNEIDQLSDSANAKDIWDCLKALYDEDHYSEISADEISEEYEIASLVSTIVLKIRPDDESVSGSFRVGHKIRQTNNR